MDFGHHDESKGLLEDSMLSCDLVKRKWKALSCNFRSDIASIATFCHFVAITGN